MGRPREHGEQTAAALVDAAEAALKDGGLDAVSVRGVAEAVGTTTRAVYSLFESKAGLVQALAARGYELLAARVAALPPTDDAAADLVNAGVLGFRGFALERPHLFRLTFERVPAGVRTSPLVERAAAASYESLVRWVTRAQTAGVRDDLPVVEIAFAFHSLCQGLASNELLREPPPIGVDFWQPARQIEAEHLWRLALEALVAGLATGAGRA